MALPALTFNADTRSITERVNAIIKNLYNKIIPDGVLNDTRVLQVVHFQTGEVATGTTVIPPDDTIPQQTEGDQYMSLAITRKSATSKLLIEVVSFFSGTVAVNVIGAIFQDSAADALATGWTRNDLNGAIAWLGFSHEMDSGGTGATTFKFRAGLQTAGTLTFNGFAGNRFFGGTMASSIRITEYM